MSRQKTPVAEYKKLLLRLPEEVLEACNTLAIANRRSMNAQIIFVLEEWIAKQEAHKFPERAPVPIGVTP